MIGQKWNFSIILGMILCVLGLNAQVTIVSDLPNNNGSSVIVFSIQNNNSDNIVLNEIGSYAGVTNTYTCHLYQKPAAYNVAPGPAGSITAANGWSLVASNNSLSLTGNTSGSASNADVFISGMNFVIPGNSHVRLALQLATGANLPPFTTTAGSLRYATVTGTCTFSSGGVDVINCPSYGYGGTITNPTNTPRGLVGYIEYTVQPPCTTPPTAGTSTANPSSGLCVGSPILLDLTGNSQGSGQTYQWQEATAIGGPYTNLGTASANSAFVTPATGTKYYRCEVTCSAQSATSTPVQVSVNPPFPAGTYTINSAQPTAGSNFQTFNDFIAAITCGIAGPIVVNVASGSGPYNEQVIIPEILSMSSTNTVTINGNGTTLTYGASVSTSPSTLELNGADYFVFNNLKVVATGVTYAFAAHLWNGADHNTFNQCEFSCDITGTQTTKSPFSISGSETSASASGLSGSGNKVEGCTMKGGYYGCVISGLNGTPYNIDNEILNCTVQDFYLYGIYNLYARNTIISGNIVERPNRTNPSTGYGIRLSTNSYNCLVEGNWVRNLFGGNPSSTSSAYGFYVSADGGPGEENKFINNLVNNIRSNGTQYGLYALNQDYIHVYHNTIVLDNPLSPSGSTYGIYAYGNSLDIKNNVISITRAGTGTKYCLYFSTNGSGDSDFNVLFMNAPDGNNNIGYYSGAFPTLALWQTANGNKWDQNSFDLDPLFIDPITGNYTLGELNLWNTGTAVGVMQDFNNNPRDPAFPDPGAFEHAADDTGGGTQIECLLICSGNQNITLGAGECSFTLPNMVTMSGPCAPLGRSEWTINSVNGSPSIGDQLTPGIYTVCYELVNPLGEVRDSCCFDITINPYPNPSRTLACNDHIYISADENCQVMLNADMFLEGGPYGCYDNYQIIIDGQNVPQGVALNIPLGNHTYEIFDPVTGNRCWGTFTVEDKLPPVLDCNCVDEDIITPITSFTGILDSQSPTIEVSTISTSCLKSSTANRQHPYAFIMPISVTVTGTYNFQKTVTHIAGGVGTSTFSYMYIYNGPPNPNDLCDNFVSASSATSWNVVLTEGVQYYFVFAGAYLGQELSFTINITPPTGGQVLSITNSADAPECQFSCYEYDVVSEETAAKLFDPRYKYKLTTPPTATDGCGPVSGAFTDELIHGEMCGPTKIRRHWTFTDAAGWTSTCTQTFTFHPIEIEDLTPPAALVTLSCGE
nr:hypothetical protein [Saprospiraceae bacterium]